MENKIENKEGQNRTLIGLKDDIKDKQAKKRERGQNRTLIGLKVSCFLA